MNRNIFKKGFIIVTVAQLIFSLIALFASSFIWNNGDIYIQLAYNGYGWQTLVIIFLCFIGSINLLSSISQLSGTNLFQEYGKIKLLIVYGFCLFLAIIGAALETWYSKLAGNAASNILHPRFIITAVFCWLLVVSHVMMIVIVLFT